MKQKTTDSSTRVLQWQTFEETFSKLEMSISFISLVPDEIKTSALTGDTGYDTYLRDAHRQVLLYLTKVK